MGPKLICQRKKAHKYGQNSFFYFLFLFQEINTTWAFNYLSIVKIQTEAFSGLCAITFPVQYKLGMQCICQVFLWRRWMLKMHNKAIYSYLNFDNCFHNDVALDVSGCVPNTKQINSSTFYLLSTRQKCEKRQHASNLHKATVFKDTHPLAFCFLIYSIH